MKKYWFILLFLAACQSIGYNDLNADTAPNSNLLPALTPKINLRNLHSMYGSNDPRVNDVEQIFDKEVKNNLTDPYGAKKGAITFKINYIGHHDSRAYYYASLASLRLLNLLGFPAAEADESFESEVDILNNKGEIVRRYVTTVQNQAYQAMYYGYKDVKTARRKVAADNMKQTMAIVRQKINADAYEIKKLLR